MVGLTKIEKIETLSHGELVQVYNKLVPTSPVKKFETKTTAIKRVQKRLDEAPAGTTVYRNGSGMVVQTALATEDEGGIPTFLKREPATPEEKAALAKKVADDLARASGQSIPDPVRTVKEAATRRGRPTEYTDGQKITILAEGNPKRPGTSSHARFAHYVKDMLVGSYVAAVVGKEKDAKKKATLRRLALSDLRWDVDHQFIRVR